MMQRPTFHKTHGGNRKGRRRLLSVGLIFLVILVFAGSWMYRRNMTFEGVVVEKDQRMRWSYAMRPTAPDSRRYRHYLTLEDETGRQFTTRVTWRTFGRAEVGDPVLKRSGDMWPRLMTEEEVERREASDDALRLIIDAVTD